MSLLNIFNRPNVLNLKQQGDVEGLVEVLSFEKDHNLRVSAATALGEIGDRGVVVPLIKALKDRKRVRDAAARALGEIGDSEAASALVKLLEDKSWEVRATAAKALGKIGLSESIQPLEGATQDKNEIVRWNASQALKNISDDSGSKS